MSYTIDEIDKKLDQELDKLGSDYFPLPVKFVQFKKAVYDFIRETTGFSEATQEISDDIHTLVRTAAVAMDPIVVANSVAFRMDYPPQYHRLIDVFPRYLIEENTSRASIDQRENFGNEVLKKVSIIKHGQFAINQRNPNKQASDEYPIVLRKSDNIQIHFSADSTIDYTGALITYYKEPAFGDIHNPSDIAVDLPPLSVEKILDRTASALRFIAGDPDAMSNYQFDQTFGKRRG